MSASEETGPTSGEKPGDRQDIPHLVGLICEELELNWGDVDSVASLCRKLRRGLGKDPDPRYDSTMVRLARGLREQDGELAETVFKLLAWYAGKAARPRPLLKELLQVRDDELAEHSLQLARRLVKSGKLSVDRHLLNILAGILADEDHPFREPEPLAEIAAWIRKNYQPPRTARRTEDPGQDIDPLLSLFLGKTSFEVRGLAARLLDLEGEPAGPEAIEALLGKDVLPLLGPYLAYTRIAHQDLLALAGPEGLSTSFLDSFARAEAACGWTLLRQIVARLGWQRLNLGLEVSPLEAVSVHGSLPVALTHPEAAMVRSLGVAVRGREFFRVLLHGGPTGRKARKEAAAGDPVERFRLYNLRHADALADIMDMSPLHAEKVQRILGHLDRLVSDFVFLFSEYSDECGILPDIYGDLKKRILAQVDEHGELDPLSPELTRLVQMFEDPANLGEVRTLHGLKRYLHQRGLKLGFRLVDTSQAPSHTVDLVLVSPEGELDPLQTIRYADFDPPEDEDWTADVPHPVRIVADGFFRQLLHGQRSFPGVDIFLFGNEVQYYISFRNHPAFLRIDFSPPLRGGMIDLEYFGVSNYDLAVHPNPELSVIQVFFQALEFDVRKEATRLHVRYDKERSLDLGVLCRKAEWLFRLVPFLMDLDWIVGSLKLPESARRVVGEAWAERFLHWGTMPLDNLLDDKRAHIVTGVVEQPDGPEPRFWSGRGTYQDRYCSPVPATFLNGLRETLQGLGIDRPVPLLTDLGRPLGPVDLEDDWLEPLREAVGRGQVLVTDEGFVAAGDDLFTTQHETERFAEILAEGGRDAAAAVQVAGVVQELERVAEFTDSGYLGPFAVERTRLPLPGKVLLLCGLRDRTGILRMALYAEDRALCRRRSNADVEWSFNSTGGPRALTRMLREANYASPGGWRIPAEKLRTAVAELRIEAQQPDTSPPAGALETDRVLTGQRAAPGRAVGRVVFGCEGRDPREMVGAILVAETIHPDNSPHLAHAAGVVSTGGAILSHAALLANQFGKPALVVAGKWERPATGSVSLVFESEEYREVESEDHGFAIRRREEVRRQEHRLEEGDLVALDADQEIALVLGHERDVLALHAGFELLKNAYRNLAGKAGDREILNMRGQLFHARTQIEKVLGRLQDPVLTRHAVREILLGDSFRSGAGQDDRTILLKTVLRTPDVADTARNCLEGILRDLASQLAGDLTAALHRIPTARFPYEVMGLRLGVRRLRETAAGALAAAAQCDLSVSGIDLPAMAELETAAAESMTRLAADLAAGTLADGGLPAARHRIRQIERVDAVLADKAPVRNALEPIRTGLEKADAEALRQARDRRILVPEDCGLELHSLTGGKAANLGEIRRLAETVRTPPWFVVTDRALQDVLDAPLSPGERNEAGTGTVETLRDAIGAVLADDTSNPAQQADLIREYWRQCPLPDDLEREIRETFDRTIGDESGAETDPLVAIRSSTGEEDTEVASRAGEFDTFLFIRGVSSVLDHLKLTWSSLWNERAIHHRCLLGMDPLDAGGGVIVQAMVQSRVSGVMLTVNQAGQDMREIVISVGLGLGEGIVSGLVGADTVTVKKSRGDSGGELQFHYATADKPRQVVFNDRAGTGTRVDDTLYHQRLRPALEYVELLDLVDTAQHLEQAYGYPLDIEFAFEGTRLWILQARPVANFLGMWSESAERFPLDGGPAAAAAVPNRGDPQ